MGLLDIYLNRLLREKYTEHLKERYKDKTVPVRIMENRMRFRRYYCHRCGERLTNHPTTQVITPDDKQWLKHCRRPGFEYYSKVALTEYDFHCPACNRFILPEEQYEIGAIQRILKTRRLSESDIAKHQKQVKGTFASQYLFMEALKKVLIVVGVILLIVGLVVLELCYMN